MIDSGSWLTSRNRQKRRPATMRILRDFEVFAGSSRMFNTNYVCMCPTNTHTYTLFSSSFRGRLSPQISFCGPYPTVFFVFFFLPLDTNRLRGESSFRPEPLRTPPQELSLVDIQFYYGPLHMSPVDRAGPVSEISPYL